MTDHLYPPEDDEPDNFEPSLADYAAALKEMERTEAEPAPLQTEVDEMRAANEALSAAVSANTPAENL